MKKQNRTLLTAALLGALSASTVFAEAAKPNYARTPWNGFHVGGLLGGKILGGKGTLQVKDRDPNTVDDMVFPLPSHTLTFGFGKEIGGNSTLDFACELEYGVLPTVKFSYGYLATPLDRVSFGLGVNALLMSTAFSQPEKIEVNSLYGFTPSISYERALGLGAYFQAQLAYNYLNIKGSDLQENYKFPKSIKRFARDYWDTELKDVTSLEATVHGFTLSLGFGYTF